MENIVIYQGNLKYHQSKAEEIVMIYSLIEFIRLLKQENEETFMFRRKD